MCLDAVAATKQVQHIADMRTETDYLEKVPSYIAMVDFAGARTMLVVPMLKEGEFVGVISIYRQEVRPFTDKQIALVQNFAAQAVIAIENTRLLNELREALQQQTATSEVLSVISSSPGELDPVFHAMLENATRICEAELGMLWRADGEGFRAVSLYGVSPSLAETRQRERIFHFDMETPLGRAARTKRLVHVTDARTDEGYKKGIQPFKQFVDDFGARTVLLVPMLKESALVGVIAIYRKEVRPFTDKQIELVQNFAAQAVIAIENTRLLNELRESLEQQTATSEVLSVISSSPSELGPVFQTMLAYAIRLCDANFGTLNLHDDGAFPFAAMYNLPNAYVEYRRRQPISHVDQKHPLGRVAATKQVLQIADMRAEALYLEKDPSMIAIADLAGARTLFVVPMLKENDLLGAITIFRREVRPFTPNQIELVENFAAQAVIAIENTRLLNELRESLQQQTATADVLKVISRSCRALGQSHAAHPSAHGRNLAHAAWRADLAGCGLPRDVSSDDRADIRPSPSGLHAWRRASDHVETIAERFIGCFIG